MKIKNRIKNHAKSFLNEIRGSLAIYNKAWKIRKRYPLSLAFFAFAPLLWLLPHLIYGTAVTGGRYSAKLESLIGFGDVLVFTALGLVFIALFHTTMWGTAYSIRDEEFLGTLDNMYIAPISRFSIILGNSAFSISQAAVGCTLQMIIIGVWYKDSFNIGNLLLATVFMVLAIIMVQGVSMVLVSFVFWQKEGWRSILIVHSVLMFLTPIAFPIVVLPNYLQGIAKLNPLTFAIEGFRDAYLFGVSFEVMRYLFILIIAVPILLALGIIIFQITEKLLRKKALLGQY
jgi:ABC-2 type transport system permease protein